MIRRIALIVFALAFSGVALADSRGSGPGKKRPGGAILNQDLDRVADALELDDTQKAKISAIREKFKADTQADLEAAGKAHEKMRALWTSGAVPAKSDVAQLHGEVQAHRMAMADKAIDARIAVLEILTPEQRKKLGSLRGQKKGYGKGGGKMGKGKGKGKGREP